MAKLMDRTARRTASVRRKIKLVGIKNGRARLSVFRGGFERAAAEQVAGATLPALTRLVDQTLVRMSLEGRYDVHDLLSQFGAEKLQQTGAEAAARRGHFQWYYTQAEHNERMLSGADTLKAFVWLIREAANLREALAWAQVNAPAQAAQMVTWMHAEFHQTGVHKLTPPEPVR